MWLSITDRSVFGSVMLDTQPGSCECQTVVWPRIRSPWAVAWLTIWSAGPKLKLPRDGSMVSHFISFSGVIMLNSRSRMVAYVESPSRPAATAVPKYRPDTAAWAPNVLAAWARFGTRVTALTTMSAAAPLLARVRIRRRRVRICFIIDLLRRGAWTLIPSHERRCY